ncbi:MAG: hypothetical protein ACI9F9_000417 [Candidatus Paceibacteria bacterium]|jgi:hypothetical protein
MLSILSIVPLLLPQPSVLAQDGFDGSPLKRPSKVEIHWNRLYDYEEIYGHFDSLVEAWPGFISMEVIGHSTQGREMRVYTINNPKTGKHSDKPGMWVDANVHGNEVQGGEVTLYLAWYLMQNYGSNDRITELVDRSTFYLLPMVNPDGRSNWFKEAHTASSSRTGYKPTDNDRDGFFDEDGPDDLNGDGQIMMMRKYAPGEGSHRLDPDDPRLMVRVPRDEKGLRGDWLMLGYEGIDNDGDGSINEDGEGGYDMNRAWPALWRPEHVQRGAGPYPLCWPEARCIADFLYEHDNVAALQSFHNAGGMILRGPGGKEFGEYDRRDLRAFDRIGKDGERMLPFYRYMIIWKDLYSVYGGFATWGYEGLGIISFTNELWTSSRNFPDVEGRSSQADRLFFDDTLLAGGGFLEWEKAQHPFYGEIEIGGYRKDTGRVPPSFLIEEMVHRNALFCIDHARAMPKVVIESSEVTELAGGTRAIDVVFRNTRDIPTRTGRASSQHIGSPDVFEISGEGIEVLAGGFRSDIWREERIALAERDSARLQSEMGIDGLGLVRVRWIVRGNGTAKVTWSGEKGIDVEALVTLP